MEVYDYVICMLRTKLSWLLVEIWGAFDKQLSINCSIMQKKFIVFIYIKDKSQMYTFVPIDEGIRDALHIMIQCVEFNPIWVTAFTIISFRKSI